VSDVSRFDRDTAVTPIDAGSFEARVDRGWWIHRGPNGGYVAALLLRALQEAVGDEDRAARSLTTVSGRMWQGERLCAVALAAFSRRREAPEFQDQSMPEVAPPEKAEPIARVGPGTIPIRERYEQRSVFPLGSGAGRGRIGGWIRLAEPRVADALLVAAFSDSWAPAVYARRWSADPPVTHGVPTVDLTVHFRTGLPLADAKSDDFYLTLFRTGASRDGFLEEDGEIWSASGTLIAQSRQLAILV
jgi:acyl-CoA thioesterase